MTALRRFWRGELPLGEAFWLWGILGGGVVSLFATLLAVMLLSFDAPAWLVVACSSGISRSISSSWSVSGAAGGRRERRMPASSRASHGVWAACCA